MQDLNVKQKAFLAAFAKIGVITHAAKAANISRRSVPIWRANNPVFADAFEDAEQEAADGLIVEAHRRAVEGTGRKKFDRNGEALIDPETGKPYLEVSYSDRLLERLLEAKFPELFKRKQNFDFSKLTLDELLVECEKAGIYFRDPPPRSGADS